MVSAQNGSRVKVHTIESQRLAIGRLELESPTDVGSSCQADEVEGTGRRQVGN